MWARVENDHHKIGDVFAGAGIGFLSGFIFTRRLEIAEMPVEISPLAFGRAYGLRISGRW